MGLKQVCILVAMLCCDSMQFGVEMGPFDIVVVRFDSCAEPGEGMISFKPTTTFVKEDGKKIQLFGGDISLPFSKEEYDALILINEFYQKKNNDYLLMYKYEDNFCLSLDTYCKKEYLSARENLGMNTDECAVHPGNYTMVDYRFDFDLPTPMLEYGGYKVLTRLLLGTKIVGCIESFGEVRPKST